MNIKEHLTKLEELADAYAGQDGGEIAIARRFGVPVEHARNGLSVMRSSFLIGALAASGLLLEGDHDIPEEWLRKNKILKV